MSRPMQFRGRSKRISVRAAEDISSRAEASRPLVLEDLTKIVRHRSGQITGAQVATAAALMAAIQPGTSAATLSDWLDQVGATSPICVEDAMDLALKIEPNIPAVRSAFNVTEREAVDLSLSKLVSERLRSTRRRRDEGISEQGVSSSSNATSSARAPQWHAEGVSRATWYRRQANAPVAAVRDAARDATGLVLAVGKPWIAAGISRTAWYRRQRAASPKSGGDETSDKIPRDQIGCTRAFLSHYRVVASLRSCFARPARSSLPTAEGRRLDVLAEKYGYRWSMLARGDRPDLWYDPPTTQLDVEELQEFDIAVSIAVAAEQRREAVHRSRARKADAEKPNLGRGVSASPSVDPQACPRRVSPAVWAEVPTELRQRVKRHAGLLFLQGHKPDAAIALAVEEAAREAAAEAAIEAALPAPPDWIAAAARRHWMRPTADAVANAKADFKDEFVQMEVARAKVTAAIDIADPPVRLSDVSQVIEAAAMLMIGWPHSPPGHAINVARHSVNLTQPPKIVQKPLLGQTDRLADGTRLTGRG